MLRRENHESRAEQRVGSRGEHHEVAGGGGERDAGTLAATDPVALHQLDGLGPVEPVEVVDEPVAVGRDPHHPLPHVALEHGVVADVAAALGGHFLVREDRAEAGAPVHGCIGEVHEAVVVENVALLAGRQ